MRVGKGENQMSLRVGSIAFATDQGLGYLVKDFYDNGIVTDVAVLEHGRRTTHLDWYPECHHITTKPWLDTGLKAICKAVDVMFFFETPFDWDIIPYCQSIGTKTVLMPMYECSPDPRHLPAIPDKFICPSRLDLDIFSAHFGDKSVFIPVPVTVPWIQRTRALRFVHNAGNLGLRGRNGTAELLAAMQYVKSPIEITIRAQAWKELIKLIDHEPKVKQDTRITFEGHVDYDKLYAGFDVTIAPEKFNGLTLPLQEARAQGLLVVSTNRYPTNTWLPTEPLIEVRKTIRSRVARQFIEFEECILEPELIAKAIDDAYDTDITDYSLSGKSWAESMSWDKLKPRYLEALATC